MIEEKAHSHHDHAHPRDDEHKQERRGILTSIASALHLPGFSHSHEDPGYEDGLYTSDLGIRTVKLALLALGLTTLLQLMIYFGSGSVALLADSVHNLGDALNSLPLWIALVIGRWAANKRYTYGYGRAEDVAGLLIVVSIAFSAGYILWESVEKFIRPQPLTNLGWVAAAAVIGFTGNELVALMQIRVGQQIGSEAMITDGRHARIDGLTSLAVLPAVIGAWIGWPLLDPIIGALIGVAILFITRDAIVATWYRLMDAVDPSLVESAEAAVRSHPQVKNITAVRLRWIGHRLFAEARIGVIPSLTLRQGNAIASAIIHDLHRRLPNLTEVTLAVVPADDS